MKILFTKTFDNLLFLNDLNENIETHFLDFIKIEPINLIPSDLKNNALIFTSRNGVQSFFKNNFKINQNKIFCVGEKTEKQLQDFGFQVINSFQNAEKLAEYLIENFQKEVFLHFCGNLTLDILDKKLSSQDIKYERIICYETELLYPKIDKKYDALVFFSPSGVRSFAKNNSLENSALFSIGETTSAEIKKITKNNIITSEEQTLKSLLNLINKHFEADNL